jgi:hypothetical protein
MTSAECTEDSAEEPVTGGGTAAILCVALQHVGAIEAGSKRVAAP